MADKLLASAPRTLAFVSMLTIQLINSRTRPCPKPLQTDNLALGYDGVLRTFDKERNVLDAVGLNPTQIREYYDGLPMPERLLTADGCKISRGDMFQPDPENIPRKFTEEDIATARAYNEELERRGVTSCIPGKSADDGESNLR